MNRVMCADRLFTVCAAGDRSREKTISIEQQPLDNADQGQSEDMNIFGRLLSSRIAQLQHDLLSDLELVLQRQAPNARGNTAERLLTLPASRPKGNHGDDKSSGKLGVEQLDIVNLVNGSKHDGLNSSLIDRDTMANPVLSDAKH
mmetsp:Transcript_139394/g.241439  ORF Transcript_139394/g.241439 Transcript_139394/m.241439 type:complete len:145 (+) Transcript_139394:27-461(+)